MKQHTYIAIDLKSFYASVECRERGLDPLDTNLVVADESRTDKIQTVVRFSMLCYTIFREEVRHAAKRTNVYCH